MYGIYYDNHEKPVSQLPDEQNQNSYKLAIGDCFYFKASNTQQAKLMFTLCAAEVNRRQIQASSAGYKAVITC